MTMYRDVTLSTHATDMEKWSAQKRRTAKGPERSAPYRLLSAFGDRDLRKAGAMSEELTFDTVRLLNLLQSSQRLTEIQRTVVAGSEWCDLLRDV